VKPPANLSFINYPILLAQINKNEPKKVYSDDPRAHMTWKGMISPEDRQVVVSKTVSSD